MSVQTGFNLFTSNIYGYIYVFIYFIHIHSHSFPKILEM